MKNTLLDNVGSNIQSAKQTITNLFNKCANQHIHHQQIDFEDVLKEQNNPPLNQLKTQKQDNLQSKIQQAIANSSIAWKLYQQKDPEKRAEQCIQKSQVLKELQNEVSVSNVSQILMLKVEDKNQEQQVQMAGILYKYSPSIFGGWSDRFCMLTKKKFVYMEDKNKNSPIAGFINFNILSFSVELKYLGKKIDSFEIKVDKGDKNFIFKAQTPQQTFKWYEKISNFIQSSEGKINKITALSNYHRFWRKQYVTQKEFEKMAKTGDILLFRGKKTSSVLQRAVTGQEFDHIGVVLLNAFDQILIFQANGGLGVGICPWKKFVKNKWFEEQQIVAIRHLKIKRNEEFLNEVTKFVQDNIGKEYKFSLKNYFMNRHSEIDNEKTSYFCSSLVAKLYKKLGLLDRNLSSSQYMPYDFSDKQKLNILYGKYGAAQLQREKIIVFDKKQRNKIFQTNP